VNQSAWSARRPLSTSLPEAACLSKSSGPPPKKTSIPQPASEARNAARASLTSCGSPGDVLALWKPAWMAELQACPSFEVHRLKNEATYWASR
jgi:hypothetical protein